MEDVLRGFGALPAASARRPGERREMVLFDTVSWTALKEVKKRHCWRGFFLVNVKEECAAKHGTGRALQSQKGCRNAFLEQVCL